MLQLYEERIARYQAAPGLLNKYYLHDPASGTYGGVYLWESKAAMERFWTAEARANLKGAYEIEGEPRVEDFEVVQAVGRERPG
ncbi:MAG TPA: YdhR family protein [Candidatus Thermoplasmatota archaeon]